MYNVLNKNDVRYQTTHATIRNAYKELLSQKNYLTISVTEICKLANINRGTFYIHYKDSVSVMNELEDEIFLQMVQFTDDFIFQKESRSEISYKFSDYIKTDDGDFIDKVLNGDYGSGKLYLRICDHITSIYFNFFENAKHLTTREKELLSAILASASIGLLREWHNTKYENIEEETELGEKILISIMKTYGV